MKKILKKRILSFLLITGILFSLMPTNIAFADSTVTFTDPILQNYMCSWVGKASGSTIDLSDITSHAGIPIIIPQGVSTLAGMENLAGLTIPQIIIQQGTISDLTPIKDIKGVTSLDIFHNSISDISCLNGYTGLQQVQLMWNNISDISVISNWTNIQNLDLSFNNISNISPLSGLTTLQYLKVRHNNISDISPVTNLTALFQLDIQENNISSLAPVNNLINMQNLSVDHNQISDITPLKNMANLDYLSISDNNITDITPLTNITKMTIFYANRIGFSNLEPLKNSTKLQIVQVDGNQISDISPLAGLLTLQELSVDSNQISDISPVKSLTNLNTFWAWGNQITDISGLKNLTGLQSLQLMSNKINDISVINNLVNLQMLNLGYNRITDFSPITHINNISQYTYLNDNYSNIFSGTVKDYIDGISVMKVTTPQHKLYINQSNVSIGEGSTANLQYAIADTTDGTFVTPSNYSPINSGSNIVLTSNDPSIATVDQNGNIQAVSVGSTTITAELFGINAEYTRQDITVNVSAAPKGSITIKYQDENGTDIATSTVISNLSLGTYSYNPIVISGFTPIDTSKSVILTAGNKDQTIIFNYTSIKGSITIKYQDENGTDITTPDVITNLDLGTYTENAKSFSNYTLNDSTSKTISLTEANKDKIVVFSYNKIKGSITVKYQDENGTDITTPDVITNLDLGTYTENAKSFSNYTLNDSTSKTITLTADSKDQTITFKYSKIKGSVTIVGYDENGNKIYTYTDGGLDLGNYTINAPGVDGWILNDVLSKLVSLSADAKDKIVSFLFRKPVGSITIKYVDDNNKAIISDVTYSKLSLGKHTFNAKSLDGYTLNDDYTKSATLSKDGDSSVITFKYSKIVPEVKTGTVRGYLKNEDGTPIANATIELHSTPRTTTTDINGYFEFKDVEIGDHKLYLADKNLSPDPILLKSVTVKEDDSIKGQIPGSEFRSNKGMVEAAAFSITDKSLDKNLEMIVALNVKGKITIQYMYNGKLITQDVMDNQDMGKHTVKAKDIKGYKLTSGQSADKNVELTEANRNVTITFEYAKSFPILPPVVAAFFLILLMVILKKHIVVYKVELIDGEEVLTKIRKKRVKITKDTVTVDLTREIRIANGSQVKVVFLKNIARRIGGREVIFLNNKVEINRYIAPIQINKNFDITM